MNKVSQDPDDTNEDDKVGSSIEGTKKTSVCVTPHRSGLTPPPYKNKRDYKGGTNDKKNDSHTPDSGVSRSDDASVTRNLDEEKEPTNMMIKTNKSAHDDQSCLAMTASLDGGRIPRKKEKRNCHKLQ